MCVCVQTSAAFVIQQLSGPLLIRMVHTRDGSRLAMLCIKHGSAKVLHFSSSYFMRDICFVNIKTTNLKLFVIIFFYRRERRLSKQ